MCTSITTTSGRFPPPHRRRRRRLRTRRQPEQVARLVDVVELPAGTVELDRRQLVVTLDPVRALVVNRRALPVVLDLAPALGTPGSEVPLHPA
jgi:hypothetical protein